MKKFNLLLLLVVTTLGLTTITSCSSSSEENALPTISFNTEGVYEDVTGLALDAPILFKMNLDQSIDTKKNIKTLTVKSISNNTINVDTLINVNKDNSLVSLNFYASSTYETAEKFTFTIEDNAGVIVTKDITVTTMAADTVVIEPAGTISSFTATLLGAQSNATQGSFLDAHTGTVHLTSSAYTNAADIDLIYFYGNTQLASLVAPSNDFVNGGGTNLSLAVGMTTQNATVLALSTITATEFDAMSDAADFPTSITGTSTNITNFNENNVIEFITQDGKIGLIKVTTINTGAAGDVTIDVKIQD